VLHEKTPRAPCELFPVVLFLHHHRLTIHYH
jgi:hypothetical protein